MKKTQWDFVDPPNWTLSLYVGLPIYLVERDRRVCVTACSSSAECARTSGCLSWFHTQWSCEVCCHGPAQGSHSDRGRSRVLVTGRHKFGEWQTDTTHKRVVGICCDFTEFMFSLYSIQTKNKSEGHVSLVGTVWKLLLVTSAIFKKSTLSGTGVRHKASLEEEILSLGM